MAVLAACKGVLCLMPSCQLVNAQTGGAAMKQESNLNFSLSSTVSVISKEYRKQISTLEKKVYFVL